MEIAQLIVHIGAVVLDGDGGALGRRRSRRPQGESLPAACACETDIVVHVGGDRVRPRLEPGKHTEYGWSGREDLERLEENRASGETLVHDVIAAALDLRG